LRTVNICVSKAVIVLKGNVPSKKTTFNIKLMCCIKKIKRTWANISITKMCCKEKKNNVK